MSILITGGSGLLGTSLNITNSVKPSSKELDLLNYEQLAHYIRSNNVKKIVHAAALVGGVHANTHFIHDFFSKNLQINLNILKACEEFKLNNSIFILSTCIFPADGPFPLIEKNLYNGEPHFTNYGYAYAKRMLEVGSRTLKQQYNINTTCLIPCNFYGPNDNHSLEYGHVIPSLIHKCHLAKINNTDFSIWGSGTPEREFIHVSDLAKVISILVKEEKQYSNSIIVSSGISYTIRQIVDTIVSKMNFKGSVVFDTSKPDGILKKPSSNEVFCSNFENFQWMNLEDGLDSSINYFTKNYPNVRK